MMQSRREWLCAAAGYGVAGATGCSIRATSTNRQLLIWSAPRGVEEQAFLRLCRRFEAEHAGISVRNLGGTLEEKFVRAVVAGDPPDLAYLYGSSGLGPLAASGAIQPLEARYQAIGFRDDQFLPGAIEASRYQGTLFAMPVTRDTRALYWSPAAFREAGLDPGRPPETLEELERLAARLTRRKNGRIDRLGFLYNREDALILLMARGAVLHDEKTGQPCASRQENIEALEWLVAFTRALGGRESLNVARSSLGAAASAQNALASGKAAMLFEGEWFSLYLEKYSPGFHYEVGRVPHPASRPDLANMAWQDGDVMLLPTGSRNPQEAWKFMVWMQREPQQREYADAMTNLPALRSLASAPSQLAPTKRRRTLGFVLREIAAKSRCPRFFPASPVARLYRAELDYAVEAAELGWKTPRQALDDAQRRIMRELERYRM